MFAVIRGSGNEMINSGGMFAALLHHCLAGAAWRGIIAARASSRSIADAWACVYQRA